ncbi:hypothetical protein E2562_035188 [Oryza meyeriana var. granulata]|uniref:Uncharacterized protein n=1 Tax=Oryza meyeriana var. granulata TaxID=110450 RepID=A0A6G1DB17_9ORYZ|nr:hypothetical protein E2562_035188 [Oryza meyeriana var. granulata]
MRPADAQRFEDVSLWQHACAHRYAARGDRHADIGCQARLVAFVAKSGGRKASWLGWLPGSDRQHRVEKMRAASWEDEAQKGEDGGRCGPGGEMPREEQRESWVPTRSTGRHHA